MILLNISGFGIGFKIFSEQAVASGVISSKGGFAGELWTKPLHSMYMILVDLRDALTGYRIESLQLGTCCTTPSRR